MRLLPVALFKFNAKFDVKLKRLPPLRTPPLRTPPLLSTANADCVFTTFYFLSKKNVQYDQRTFSLANRLD